jgi:hypothetical protein
MTIQTSLAEELLGLQYPDDRFLSLLGHDGELDPAFLDVKNRIGGVALGKDDLTFLIFRNRLSIANLGEKGRGIKFLSC